MNLNLMRCKLIIFIRKKYKEPMNLQFLLWMFDLFFWWVWLPRFFLEKFVQFMKTKSLSHSNANLISLPGKLISVDDSDGFDELFSTDGGLSDYEYKSKKKRKLYKKDKDTFYTSDTNKSENDYLVEEVGSSGCELSDF